MQFLKLFPQLYLRPTATLSRLMDEGEWWPPALAVLLVSALLQFGLANLLYQKYEAGVYDQATARETLAAYEQMRQSGELPAEARQQIAEQIAQLREQVAQPTETLPVVGRWGRWLFSFSTESVFTTILALVLLYVPSTLLVLSHLEYLGSISVVMQRMYGSLLVCTLSVWVAAHLPFALLGFAVGENATVALGYWIAAKLVFGALMVLTLRTVAGATLGNALATVSVSWLAMLFYGPVMSIVRFFPLFWVLPFALGGWAFYSGGYSQQRSFRRSLHAATINEHDAEAQYQLGLIYHQRRQFTEAQARFERAVAIDPREVDAHFQLGRLAREQGRFSDAINHFTQVVSRDDKHSLHEIWREVGATYLGAGMLNEAREALEKFIDRREYDPEGLYLLAETMDKLGDQAKARELFQRCHEAAASMPYHRRRETGRWGKLAKAKRLTT
jgi:tetratricopeptide (TPR) repeat protein